MNIALELNDWQHEFFTLPIEGMRLANYGEFRSGKTTTCGVKFIKAIREYPDTNWAIIRNQHGDLEKSTIPQFKKLWDWDYTGHKYNDQKKILYLHDGSMVYFLALDKERDIKKLKNLELGGVWIDQSEEIMEDIYNMAWARINKKPRFMMCSGNSEGKQWDYYNFFTSPLNTVKGSYSKNGITKTLERGIFKGKNEKYLGMIPPPFLNEENLGVENYYDDLIENNSSEWSDKYVWCIFGGHAGLIHRDFKEDIHVVRERDYYKPPELWQRIDGMDYGISAPTCWLFAWYARDTDTIHIFDEYYVDGQTISFHGPKIENLRNEYGRPISTTGCPRAFATERDGKTPAQQYRDDYNISLTQYPIGLETRVEICNKRFKQNKIVIWERCQNLLRQIQGTTWKNYNKVEIHALEAFQRLVAKTDKSHSISESLKYIRDNKKSKIARPIMAGVREMDF